MHVRNLACSGLTASGLLLGDRLDDDVLPMLFAEAVGRDEGPRRCFGWARQQFPRLGVSNENRGFWAHSNRHLEPWKSLLGGHVASGFCAHSLRGVIIPKPVPRVGIRRAAYRNGFRDIENPSQGHLLGDYPLSPRNDRFCEGKIIRVTVLTTLTSGGQHSQDGQWSVQHLANTPAKTAKKVCEPLKACRFWHECQAVGTGWSTWILILAARWVWNPVGLDTVGGDVEPRSKASMLIGSRRGFTSNQHRPFARPNPKGATP
jgi:hypothetical protein